MGIGSTHGRRTQKTHGEVPQKTSRFPVHYAFLIVCACTVISSVVMGFIYGCTGIFYTPVSSYFGVPLARFTLYFSIFNLTLTLALPFMGALMMSMNRRILLTICACGLGGSVVGMSFATQIWHFYVCGAIMGVTMSPFVYLVVPTFVNEWFAKRVGFFSSFCLTFTGVAGIVFNPICTNIINASPEGWRTAYRLIGLLIIGLTVPCTALVLRDHPSDLGLDKYGADDPDGVDPASNEGVRAHTAFASKAFIALFILSAAMAVVQTINQYLPGFASSLSETNPEVAASSGYLGSASMAGAMIGAFVLGLINDRSVRAGTIFIVTSAICGFAFMWFGSAHLPGVLVGAFVFGIGYGGTSIQTALLTRACFGSLDYTVITARVSMAGAAAASLSGFLWGLAVDSSFGYALVFGAGSAAMVAVLVLMIYSLQASTELERVEMGEATD